MGNCYNSCTFYRKQKRNVTLVIIGLDNSGKTTLAKKLAGEPIDSVLKTLGFSLIVLHYHGYRISLYDLGGSAQIRDIWSKYFMDAHGVIYMVDASDLRRLAEAKSTFVTVLSHGNISGKPILLLANKQDKENVLDELEIVDQLDVELIVNKYKCPTRVEICSAIGYENGKIDLGIKNGFRWLIDNIIANYKILDERVQRDMADYAIQVQKDKEEWRSRIEAKNSAESSDDGLPRNGNPFQPIDQLLKSTNGRLINEDDAIKLHNGAATGAIDNSVQSKEISNSVNRNTDFVEKTELRKIQQSIMNTITETIRENKSKLNQQYHKHKKKFFRFNKTAPMPIDFIMRGEFFDTKLVRETSKYSVKSNLVVGAQKEPEKHIKNYLLRRPATAPSKFHFSKVKVNAAWDLTAPLEISASSSSRVLFINHRDSDSEDSVSFF